MLKKLLLSSLLPATAALAQNPVTIALENFATGFSSPVDIAHCGDDRLFIVEQGGRIRILAPNGSIWPTPFLDIQTIVNDNGGEQGLLGMAFDPNYAENGRFYVNYIFGSGNGTTRVSRFTVTNDGNVADPTSEEVLLSVPQPASNHNGGDLAFGADGYLYIGFGDGGSANDPWNNAQTLTNMLGDMVRIDVSGETGYTVPASNPWVGLGNDTLPEIWASGLRNPWRFGFDSETGDLWIGDVGQGQREEVDFWPAGNNSGPNFGWRCYEGDIATPGINDDCPPASAFVAPVAAHTRTDGWCSIIGGRVYRGTEFPRLTGRYIYTDYCPTPYFSLRPNGSGGWVREQLRTGNGGAGTSAIGENSSGELFVANVNTGTIRRIVDQCPMPAPTIDVSGFQLTSTPADSYAWFVDDELIPGAITQTITAEQEGAYHVVGTYNTTCSLMSDTVVIIGTAVVGPGAVSFSVQPVPARDRITISGVPANVERMELVDMTGRKVLTEQWNGAARGVLDVSELGSANYVLRLVDANGNSIGQRSVQVQR